MSWVVVPNKPVSVPIAPMTRVDLVALACVAALAGGAISNTAPQTIADAIAKHVRILLVVLNRTPLLSVPEARGFESMPGTIAAGIAPLRSRVSFFWRRPSIHPLHGSAGLV